jgi:hypothetical protein
MPSDVTGVVSLRYAQFVALKMDLRLPLAGTKVPYSFMGSLRRTISTEQGARVTSAIETLPSRNRPMLLLALGEPTKMQSAMRFVASSQSTC